jgi:hypothetical protein
VSARRTPPVDAPFRLPGATRRDAAVEAWFAGEPRELRSLARTWFEAMRGAGDDVREILHDGAPTACVGDVAFGYVAAFRAHVNVGFFAGAWLPDPHALLVGSGRRMRHVKLVPGQPPESRALAALIEAACNEARTRAAQHGS